MTILDEIAAARLERVAAEKRRVPPGALLKLVRETEEGRASAHMTGISAGRRFIDALRAPGMRFICEVNRVSPSKSVIVEDIYSAWRLTEDVGGARIYLKREDLNHTGAHKINNALGQALLAKKMGKTCLIAETGDGQHGVATATVAALLDMECVVYMGTVDMERQALNVYKMRLVGARVHGVDTGTGTLKDVVNACMREWTSRIADTHYCLGSCMGPHSFPTIVRDFQAVVGREMRGQVLEATDVPPDYVIACVGGGSNAIGNFYHFPTA